MRPATHWRPAQGEPTVTALLRHGQTPMSVQKRYAGRTDAPLTEVGAQQAAAAAKRLASAGLGVIVTSPLLRTVQTAQAVAAVTGAYTNEAPHYLQTTGFLLGPDGRILNAVYSSGPIGRLVAEDVVGMVSYLKSKS